MTGDANRPRYGRTTWLPLNSIATSALAWARRMPLTAWVGAPPNLPKPGLFYRRQDSTRSNDRKRIDTENELTLRTHAGSSFFCCRLSRQRANLQCGGRISLSPASRAARVAPICPPRRLATDQGRAALLLRQREVRTNVGETMPLKFARVRSDPRVSFAPHTAVIPSPRKYDTRLPQKHLRFRQSLAVQDCPDTTSGTKAVE
jgi:hypothetical protein